MNMRFSENLVISDDQICCKTCGRPLAPANGGWKQAAVLTVIPVKDLPGAGSNTDSRVVLRRFACGSCGSLLETEVSLPEDPFLEDRIILSR